MENAMQVVAVKRKTLPLSPLQVEAANSALTLSNWETIAEHIILSEAAHRHVQKDT